MILHATLYEIKLHVNIHKRRASFVLCGKWTQHNSLKFLNGINSYPIDTKRQDSNYTGQKCILKPKGVSTWCTDSSKLKTHDR